MHCSHVFSSATVAIVINRSCCNCLRKLSENEKCQWQMLLCADVGGKWCWSWAVKLGCLLHLCCWSASLGYLTVFFTCVSHTLAGSSQIILKLICKPRMSADHLLLLISPSGLLHTILYLCLSLAGMQWNHTENESFIKRMVWKLKLTSLSHLVIKLIWYGEICVWHAMANTRFFMCLVFLMRMLCQTNE